MATSKAGPQEDAIDVCHPEDNENATIYEPGLANIGHLNQFVREVSASRIQP